MRRRLILITVAIVLAVPVVTVAALLLYLRVADLGAYRPTVERIAGDALGRELRIAGELRIEAGLTTRVVATDVSLANPAWADEPAFVTIDRLELAIRPLALLRRTLEIPQLAVDGARVVIASDAEGRGTWQLGTSGAGGGDTATAADEGRPLVLRPGTVSLRRVTIALDSPGASHTIALDEVDAARDDGDVLDVSLAGRIDGLPVTLSARGGTLADLLRGGPVEATLTGGVADVDVAASLAATRLDSLAGLSGSVEIEGPDLERVRRALDLPGGATGPFRVEVRASPVEDRTSVELAATLEGLDAAVEGTVDSPVRPRAVDVAVRASGPDLAALGALVGRDSLPGGPFRVTGRVAWDGYPLRLDDVRIDLGEDRARIDGVLGALPEALDTDLRVELEGPDASRVAALAGRSAPAEPYRVAGRLARADGGIRLEGVEARLGAASLAVTGFLGDPPRRDATDLAIRVEVPDAAHLGRLIGVALPALPLDAAGRLRAADGALRIDGTEAHLGEHVAHLDGTLGLAPGLVGTDVAVTVEGPGLAWLDPWVGDAVSALPPGDYRVSGGVAVGPDAIELDDVDARVGEITARLAGRVAMAPDLVGSDVRVRASGPDLAAAAAIAGLEGVPVEPFLVAGGARVEAGRTVLDDVRVEIGGWTVEGGGAVGHGRGLEGTSVRLSASGPLAELGPLLGRELPDVPARLDGGVDVVDGGYRADGLDVRLGEHRLVVSGMLRNPPDLEGTRLDVELGGPRLAELADWLGAAGAGTLPTLPGDPYSVRVGVSVDATGYGIRDLAATLGDARATVAGRVGRSPGYDGSELVVSADGPGAAWIGAIAGVDVPDAPFRVRGTVARDDGRTRLDGVELELATYRLDVDGTLGDPPALAGSDLVFHAEGPDLVLPAALLGEEEPPDAPFAVAGRLRGDTARVRLGELAVTLGASDLRGSIEVEQGPRPRVTGRLASDRIDAEALLGPPVADGPPAADAPAASLVEPATAPAEYAIPREPFDLEPLGRLDADLVWTVGALHLPIGDYRDLDITAELHDGALQLGPVTATDGHGGSLHGGLTATIAPTGVEAALDVSIAGARFDMSQVVDDRTDWPSIDVDVSLVAAGDSPHALASTANGEVLVVVGAGAIDRTLVNLATTDIVRTILDALTPFRRKNPASRLECAIVRGLIEDGVARFDPVAVRTDTLTAVGGATIDLDSEEIDLAGALKPRTGIGVSASALANPYLKMGGTLSRPRLEMRPMRAAASTGAAVATGGLSILGRGLWDRITAERDVCGNALDTVRKERSRDADLDVH